MQQQQVIAKYPWWFRVYQFVKSIFSYPFFKNKICSVLLILNFLFGVGFWIYLKLTVEVTQTLVPIQFRIYEKNTIETGSAEELLIRHKMGLAIILLNLVLAFSLYKKEKYLSYFLLIGALISQAILIGYIISLLRAW